MITMVASRQIPVYILMSLANKHLCIITAYLHQYLDLKQCFFLPLQRPKSLEDNLNEMRSYYQSRSLSRFNSVKRKQLERLRQRSDWFLSPNAARTNGSNGSATCTLGRHFHHHHHHHPYSNKNGGGKNGGGCGGTGCGGSGGCGGSSKNSGNFLQPVTSSVV